MESKPWWRYTLNVKSEMSYPYPLRYFHFFSQSKMVLLGGNYLVSLSNCCFIMRLYKEFCPILISFGLSRSSTIILIIVRCEIAWELYMHVCLQLENESFSFLFFITFKNKYIVCKRASAELAYLDYAVKYEIPPTNFSFWHCMMTTLWIINNICMYYVYAIAYCDFFTAFFSTSIHSYVQCTYICTSHFVKM